jgi:excisionase family DNA binding protein
MKIKPKPLSADEPIPLAHPLTQAATRLGIGKSTLYSLIDAREIHAFKVGIRTLVAETELQRFIQQRMKAGS